MTKVSELVSSQVGNAITNAKIWGGVIINVKSYGAKGDGITDDTSSINQALNAAKALGDGTAVVFPDNGVYMISSPITIDKVNPLIAYNRATIKPLVSMDSLIHCLNLTTYGDTHISGFLLDAANLANNCIKIEATTGNYIVRVTVEDCICRNAVQDGIVIIPPAYSITIRNTMITASARDGIRAIMTSDPGTNQVNNILIDGCTILQNTTSAVNILGVMNTIQNCDIEQSAYGIKIDATQCSGSYASHHINIVENYIEGNTTNQIYVNSPNGDGIYVNVTDNYLNPTGTGACIACTGTSEGVTINFGQNRWETSKTNNIIDGGNVLNSKSLIRDQVYLKESQFVNLGFARILWDYFKAIPLPATSAWNVAAKSVYETENIISLTTKSIVFPVQVDVTQALMDQISATITSDCSSFSITCYIQEFDLTSGNAIRTTSFTISGANNLSWAATILNNWGYTRVASGHGIVVQFDLTSYTGTTLTIKNVALKTI